ncbi:transposase family protein [Streptomyces hydrogenans]|uniref:transposase family protein n=1 Tax=Streptomyces hydrogenans TaxID=1873719 RepID=UPI0037F3BA54
MADPPPCPHRRRPRVTTPFRRLPNRDLTTAQQTADRALSAARVPVERSVARLKSWRVFRKARRSPDRRRRHRPCSVHAYS